MDYSLILKAFVAQVVIIFIIIFILKKTLDNQLIESAIEKLRVLNPENIQQDLDALEIISYCPLNENLKNRISDTISKKMRRKILLKVVQDKKIKGGIIIKCREIVIDHSLINRLKESGMIK